MSGKLPIGQKHRYNKAICSDSLTSTVRPEDSKNVSSVLTINANNNTVNLFVSPHSPKLEVSRVSKSNLFRHFRDVCRRAGRSDLLAMTSYAQAKMASTSFQIAKEQFFKALGQLGYGAWIGRPQEEKSFEAEETEAQNVFQAP